MPALNLVRICSDMYYGNTFNLISRSPAAKVGLLSQNNSAVHSQKELSVYFTSILPFGFSGLNCDPCTLNSLDLFHDTMCVQAHLNFYTGAAKCWRHWPKILTILGLGYCKFSS